MDDRTHAVTVIERTYKAKVEELWSLWTTKEGFASWWGPQGFRVDVRELDARQGGVLHYDMIADAPQMVAAMKASGQAVSHETRGAYTEFEPHARLVLTHLIDFLPGVEPYDSRIEVEFSESSGEESRMVVTLFAMHDDETSRMQRDGFTSQLTKLDERYGWKG